MAAPVHLTEADERGRHLIVDARDPIAQARELEQRVLWRRYGLLHQVLGHVTADLGGSLSHASADHGLARVDMDNANAVDGVPVPDVLKHLLVPCGVAQGAVDPYVLLTPQRCLLAQLLEVGALPVRQGPCIHAPLGVPRPLRHQSFEIVRVDADDVLDGEVAQLAELLEGVAFAATHRPASEDNPRAGLRVVACDGQPDDRILPCLPLARVGRVVVVVATRRRLARRAFAAVGANQVEPPEVVVRRRRAGKVEGVRHLKTAGVEAREDLGDDARSGLPLQGRLAKLLPRDLCISRCPLPAEELLPDAMHLGLTEVDELQARSAQAEVVLREHTVVNRVRRALLRRRRQGVERHPGLFPCDALAAPQVLQELARIRLAGLRAAVHTHRRLQGAQAGEAAKVIDGGAPGHGAGRDR
mmetsp:Transcript_50921/g.146976  ORF Transcript_50921/g.146976 Transcript_50921/m.146976 type:complete len:415 (+) Transcript_50921:904-2148(+)